MIITGQLRCPGLQIFGRVTGEIQASHLVICEGAKVEGEIIAQETVIQGTFNGTIHGDGVDRQGLVDGEIFDKSLVIEPNVQFEGVSRRLDRTVEAPADDLGRAFARAGDGRLNQRTLPSPSAAK